MDEWIPKQTARWKEQLTGQKKQSSINNKEVGNQMFFCFFFF